MNASTSRLKIAAVAVVLLGAAATLSAQSAHPRVDSLRRGQATVLDANGKPMHIDSSRIRPPRKLVSADSVHKRNVNASHGTGLGASAKGTAVTGATTGGKTPSASGTTSAAINSQHPGTAAPQTRSADSVHKVNVNASHGTGIGTSAKGSAAGNHTKSDSIIHH